MFNWGSRSKPGTKTRGDAAEDAALAHLERAGLRLLERNYRVGAGRSRRAGEVDLIMTDGDGTLVFVEVRARADSSHGGAAASVTTQKQQRLIYAAQHYLLRHASPPPCRFDVVAIDGDKLTWLPAAFDAG
ncbi:MAG TPA: YraN family protein [Roseateles sp.]